MNNKNMEIKTKKEIKSKKIDSTKKVSVFKKRMLIWDSPVEYVNNMYGCHPNEDNMEYFDKIYNND